MSALRDKSHVTTRKEEILETLLPMHNATVIYEDGRVDTVKLPENDPWMTVYKLLRAETLKQAVLNDEIYVAWSEESDFVNRPVTRYLDTYVWGPAIFFRQDRGLTIAQLNYETDHNILGLGDGL